MSTDDLANSLVTQENLKKLGDETRSQVEAEIEAARKLKDMDKVRMLEASIGNEEDAKAALKKIDAQETFNQSIEKLKSMLSSIVEGPAAKFVDGLANMLTDVNLIKSAFGGVMKIITGISLGKMIGQLGIAAGLQAILAAGAITWASGITLGIGIAAVLGGMWAASSGFSDITKSMEPPPSKFNKGGPVPGTNTKTDSIPAMLTSGEYVIPNSNGKTGTEKYNEMISTSSPTMLNEGSKVSINPNKNTGTNSSNNIDLSPLIQAINGLRSDMKALASRPIQTSVQIDGKEVVLAQGTYSKEKGDANRMESWQMS